MNPYIGITDFTDFAQVQKMLEIFRSYNLAVSNRMLHIGVMMSHKTLHGIPSKWQDAFPPKERIASIFGSDEAYNCLHYANYEQTVGFWEDLVEAIFYGGIGIHAIQLDMIWPDPGEVANGVHASRKQIEVILQIGQYAFEEVNNHPERVVERLGDYGGVIHRILLDKSMGRGIGMDAREFLTLAEAIRNRFPALGIGVAGGLGPDTLHLVAPIVEKFPDISIDAQARLRPSWSALDPINWDLAESYLVKALQLFA